MKTKLLAIFTLICAAFVSCGDSGVVCSLGEFSADSYPTNSNIWIISDTEATTSDFAGISAAIAALAPSDREIELRFESMTQIPDYAIFGEGRTMKSSLKSLEKIVAKATESDNSYCALRAISAPEATSIGDGAFYGCSGLRSISAPKLTTIGDTSFFECAALTSINLPEIVSIGELSFAHCSSLRSINMPKVSSIGDLAFHVCHALESIEFATDPDAKLTTIGSDATKCALLNASIPAATLKVGAENKDFVDGDVLNVDGYDIAFKKIIVE